MKKSIGFFALLSIAVSLVSCDKAFVRGSGTTITETRTVSAFSSVEIVGDRAAEIIYSPDSKVEITGYENLLDIFEAKVNNGKLHFEYPHHQVVKNDNIRVKIYTPELTKTSLIGNAEAKIGSGFSANKFEGQISGNGILRLSANQFENVRIQTSGNSQVYAAPVAAKYADIDMSGNAAIEVNATEKIKIRISGSGEVKYWGDPADVDIQISGTGKARKQ